MHRPVMHQRDATLGDEAPGQAIDEPDALMTRRHRTVGTLTPTRRRAPTSPTLGGYPYLPVQRSLGLPAVFGSKGAAGHREISAADRAGSMRDRQNQRSRFGATLGAALALHAALLFWSPRSSSPNLGSSRLPKAPRPNSRS